MLQNLREHAQGWIAGVIIAILCLAFALWGIQYYLTSDSNSDVVAKVDHVNITHNQVDSLYQRLRQQINPSTAPAMDQAAQTELKKVALQQLIHNTVLAQAAQKQKFRISNAQLNAVLSQIPGFQVNGQFSMERFQQIMSALLYTPEQFFIELQQNMLSLQMQTGISNSGFALPNETNEAIRLLDQKRDISYLLIPVARFADKVSVSNQQIESYYQSHKSDFIAPEQVSIQYIELSGKQIANNLKMGEQDLQHYYQNHIGQYTTPEQWQIARIVIKIPANADSQQIQTAKTRIDEISNKIANGADFEALAKQYSDDKTATGTGTMPWFSRDKTSPLIAQISSSLKPGQVSAPFRSDDGFSVIKLIAIKPAQVQPFAQVKDQLAKNLSQQKLTQLFSAESDKLSNLTYTNPDTLKPAADALGLPIQTTGLFTRQGGKTGIISNSKIVNAAFGDNVLNLNNNSDVISLDDSTLVVLRINHHKPSLVKPLAEVRAHILDILKAESAQSAAAAQGQLILTALQKGGKPQQVAQQYALTWHDFNNASRKQANIDPQILATAFSLHLPSASPAQPSMKGVLLSTGDYAVVQVSRFVNGNPVQDSDRMKAVQKQLASAYEQLEYDLYVQEKMKKAKITISH